MRKLVFILLILLAIACRERVDERKRNFPKSIEYVTTLPKKSNLWIFILAGQSNMAGRGLVEPQDTISSPNILSIDKSLQWYLAKEPLHFNEPIAQGLDCGLSFAKNLSQELPDSIYIGLIPCAVGGSSIEQWLGDSVHRDVKLYSNFEAMVKVASEAGIIKGILWHQGESNADEVMIKGYEKNVIELFRRFRQTIGNDSVPILAGELGPFLESKFGVYPDSVNRILRHVATTDPNVRVISASDLKDKGDIIHFNGESLRLLGNRFADSYRSIMK